MDLHLTAAVYVIIFVAELPDRPAQASLVSSPRGTGRYQSLSVLRSLSPRRLPCEQLWDRRSTAQDDPSPSRLLGRG